MKFKTVSRPPGFRSVMGSLYASWRSLDVEELKYDSEREKRLTAPYLNLVRANQAYDFDP